jgi:hypothetical protein
VAGLLPVLPGIAPVPGCCVGVAPRAPVLARPGVGLGATAFLVGAGVVLREAGSGVFPFTPPEGPGVPVTALATGLPVACAPGVPVVGDTSGVAVVPVGAGVTVTIFCSPTDNSFLPSHPPSTSAPASNPNSASFPKLLFDCILSIIVAPPSGRTVRPCLSSCSS